VRSGTLNRTGLTARQRDAARQAPGDSAGGV